MRVGLGLPLAPPPVHQVLVQIVEGGRGRRWRCRPQRTDALPCGPGLAGWQPALVASLDHPSATPPIKANAIRSAEVPSGPIGFGQADIQFPSRTTGCLSFGRRGQGANHALAPASVWPDWRQRRHSDNPANRKPRCDLAEIAKEAPASHARVGSEFVMARAKAERAFEPRQRKRAAEAALKIADLGRQTLRFTAASRPRSD